MAKNVDSSLKIVFGTMRRVPARWGDPSRGIPTLLLDPVQAEEHHEPGPLPPLGAGTPPPLPAGTPPPLPAPLWEGARGKGQGARGPGSREGRGAGSKGGSSNCGRFGRENTTSRVPPTSRDPLPLLTFVKEPPTRTTCLTSTAVHFQCALQRAPPFVLLYLPGF